MTIRCLRFRAFKKNTLLGFADLELTRVGLILRDCTLHEKNGKRWIGFPAKSFTGQDGESKWTPLIEFAEGAGEARKQFQQQALEAIHAVAGEERKPKRERDDVDDEIPWATP
jgi:hypothetical protein